MQADALTLLQLDDGHRTLLTAICSLRLVAGSATDATLLAEAQRLHSGLCSAAQSATAIYRPEFNPQQFPALVCRFRQERVMQRRSVTTIER